MNKKLLWFFTVVLLLTVVGCTSSAGASQAKQTQAATPTPTQWTFQQSMQNGLAVPAGWFIIEDGRFATVGIDRKRYCAPRGMQDTVQLFELEMQWLDMDAAQLAVWEC